MFMSSGPFRPQGLEMRIMEVLKMFKTEVIHNTVRTVPEIHAGSQNVMRSRNYRLFLPVQTGA